MEDKIILAEDQRLREETFALLSEVFERHSNADECNDKEQKVLENMKVLIETYGHHDLFLYCAALAASDDWNRLEIIRQEEFGLALDEGIRRYGSLGTDREVDWAIFSHITESNPYMYFINDMNLIYELTCTAAEKGSGEVAELALATRNTIWEASS